MQTARRVKAAFILNNGASWIWRTWTETVHLGNKHAAIIEKARELGAKAWDFGQAQYEWADRANF